MPNSPSKEEVQFYTPDYNQKKRPLPHSEQVSPLSYPKASNTETESYEGEHSPKRQKTDQSIADTISDKIALSPIRVLLDDHSPSLTVPQTPLEPKATYPLVHEIDKSKQALEQDLDVKGLNATQPQAPIRRYEQSLESAPSPLTLLDAAKLQDITLKELVAFYPNHVRYWPGLALVVRASGMRFSEIARIINDCHEPEEPVLENSIRATMECTIRQLLGKNYLIARNAHRTVLSAVLEREKMTLEQYLQANMFKVPERIQSMVQPSVKLAQVRHSPYIHTLGQCEFSVRVRAAMEGSSIPTSTVSAAQHPIIQRIVEAQPSLVALHQDRYPTNMTTEDVIDSQKIGLSGEPLLYVLLRLSFAEVLAKLGMTDNKKLYITLKQRKRQALVKRAKRQKKDFDEVVTAYEQEKLRRTKQPAVKVEAVQPPALQQIPRPRSQPLVKQVSPHQILRSNVGFSAASSRKSSASPPLSRRLSASPSFLLPTDFAFIRASFDLKSEHKRLMCSGLPSAVALQLARQNQAALKESLFKTYFDTAVAQLRQAGRSLEQAYTEAPILVGRFKVAQMVRWLQSQRDEDEATGWIYWFQGMFKDLVRKGATKEVAVKDAREFVAARLLERYGLRQGK